MASEKLVLFSLVFLASWASTTLSQDVQGAERCIKNLMPCVDFLHSDERPSTICCMALKGELENDVQCLCKLLKDDKALKAFNVTQSEMIQFPTRCGLQPADVSKCEKSGDIPMPSNAPSIPQVPPKSPKEGPSRSGADPEKSMISVTGLLIIGGMLSIF